MGQNKGMDMAMAERLRSYAEAILGDKDTHKSPVDLIFISAAEQDNLLLERNVKA